MYIQKRFITLIEIMIVLVLISLIGGVLLYNFGGALEKGKAETTKLAIVKVENILSLAVAENPAVLEDLSENWQRIIRSSPLVSDPNPLLKDAWGGDFEVRIDEGKITVTSENLNQYLERSGQR